MQCSWAHAVKFIKLNGSLRGQQIEKFKFLKFIFLMRQHLKEIKKSFQFFLIKLTENFLISTLDSQF